MKLVATIAVILLNIGWAAQGWRVYKRKSSDDISLVQLFIMMIGFILLQIYTFTEAWDIIYVISNFVGLFGVTALSALTIKYRTAPVI